MSANPPPAQAPAKRKPWVSCAECRRLRIRCDRRFPCSPCRRRGCGSICPDGTTTHGTADGPFIDPTIELKDNLQKLAERVRSLENALEGFSASHPLLDKEHRAIKTKYIKRGNHSRHSSTEEQPVEDQVGERELVNRGSSLIIRDDGATECIAEEQGWWRYVHETSALPPSTTTKTSPLMLITASFSLSLLMPSVHTFLSQQQYVKVLCEYLPPAEEVLTISNHFFNFGAWMFNTISKDEFMTNTFSLFYAPGPLPDSTDDTFAHKLASLWAILAIGYYFDPNGPRKGDSENAYRFACGALLCGRGVEQPTLDSLQSLNLMNIYMWFTDPILQKSTNAAWILNGIIVKLVQAAGIHHDGRKFGLGEDEIMKRRHLVSDVYFCDYLMASLTLRPPTVFGDHFDPAHVLAQDSTEGLSFSNWKVSFVTECVAPLFAETLGTRQPPYSTIVRLDRKIREHALPTPLQLEHGQNETDTALWLQRYIANLFRGRVMLTLHQSCFARALNDHTVDPRSGPYKESVDAIYRAAISIVPMVEKMRERMPHPTDRLWSVWKTLFAAAVVIGSLIARAPDMPLASEGLARLDTAYELFAHVRLHLGQKSLDALDSMRVQARRSMQAAGQRSPSGVVPTISPSTRFTVIQTPRSENTPSSSSLSMSSASSGHGSPHPGDLANAFSYFPELGASFSAATMPQAAYGADSLQSVISAIVGPSTMNLRPPPPPTSQQNTHISSPPTYRPTSGHTSTPYAPMQQHMHQNYQLEDLMALPTPPTPFPVPATSVPSSYFDPTFSFGDMFTNQANAGWPANGMGMGALGLSAEPMPLPDLELDMNVDWSQVFTDAGVKQ